MLDLVTDLVVAAALLHLAGHFEHLLDAGRTDGVSEGKKSAAGVDRNVAANRRAAVAGQRPALAVRREAQRPVISSSVMAKQS